MDFTDVENEPQKDEMTQVITLINLRQIENVQFPTQASFQHRSVLHEQALSKKELIFCKLNTTH